MKKYSAFISGLIVLFSVPEAWANQPSHAQVIQWITNLDESHADPQQDIAIEQLEEVTLYSGETAYVSGVTFNNAGRNFGGGYILTRPQLKQSQILPFGGQANTFKVHPIYLPNKNKSIDLIEFESAGSGQGTIESALSMTYIQNWQVKTLHEVTQGSSMGRYNDKLGEEDCRSGSDSYAYLNITGNDHFILETTVETDACENKTAKDYQLKTKLIPIKIP